MKESYWAYWLVVLGVFIIVVLLLVQSFTSTNTQDYYLVKTIAEAAMEDAIDYSYYRQYGELKINKEKFYESFLRRFAEEASLATTYDIEFTEVYEAPPKVGVKVSSKANSFNIVGDAETFDIVNRIDAILESENMANGTVDTIIGEYPSSDINSLINRYKDETSYKSQLSNCKLKFTAPECATSDAAELEVYRCGKPISDEVADVYKISKDNVYCVAVNKDDPTCSVTATFDQFKNSYCN